MSKDKKQQAPAAAPSTAMENAPKNTEVVVFDYGDDLGKGFENQDKSDKAIPFIAIAQSLSKIIKSNREARAGDLYNTVTGELYGEGVYVVPAVTEKRFACFAPRDAGGGFKGQYKETDDVVVKAKKVAESTGADFGVYKTDEGNELIETFYVYCAIVDLDGNAIGMAVIGFKKTQIKLYKKWQTRLGSIMVATPSGGKRNPPMFASVWKLSTFEDKTSKGEFYNYVIEAAVGNDVEKSLLAPNDERYLMAKRMHELVQSGEAAKQVKYESQSDDGGGGGGGNTASDPVF